MTAPEPVRAPPSPDTVLTVDCGSHTRPWSPEYGRWQREPTADYRCPRCGWTDSAVGAPAVRAFVGTVQRVHLAACPNPPKEDS